MRFWDRVLVTETCWLWTGATQTRGYGSVGVGNGRTALAHRVAYQQTVGPIPDGMTIDHVCENKVCVNPDHLEVVTRAENTRRAAERASTSCYCAQPGCITCRLRIRKAHERNARKAKRAS